LSSSVGIETYVVPIVVGPSVSGFEVVRTPIHKPVALSISAKLYA
jgi:hypothetical protein